MIVQDSQKLGDNLDTPNLDRGVVDDFGAEWRRFDQSALSVAEKTTIFRRYFAIFPWKDLPADAEGFDLGCGSGRWASLVAKRVGTLHCIDPAASALIVARRNLAGQANARFHNAGVDAIPLADGSMDFGYSLGVLHHVPDTAAGIASCVAKLKPGAPFLVYLYYTLDNKPRWYRLIWRISDGVRRAVAVLPRPLKFAACQVIAGAVYWPLARIAWLLEKLGAAVEDLPLADYRHNSFYSMRTDALDRFGTRLEQRFTRAQIAAMMTAAGLRDVVFSEGRPFWCAVGRKT
ncbi:SAM-dependent methyltransferase [Caulobacter ginsengisoli]|uniref:SAM-dependent methyltransferase n=1 Tax=Caulobacter ginsengisoli TaxID=400775 RepID=A0ABU0ISE1_9CAUL|nr:class I SAM-dependent methyltransferase [Caulobacter ginsengisoli]MDQ0464928.1 SAM-dependent methyltransferase [Caulobacter ginsengisoli]